MIKNIVNKTDYSRNDIIALLSTTDPDENEAIRQAAEKVLLENCGDVVYYRGLIELSNICVNDCLYCGIRKSNTSVNRYTLTEDEIVNLAVWSGEQGYGSVVLQAGDRHDETFIAMIESAVKRIKNATVGSHLPQGVGVTLSLGEQTRETYERWFNAGAHRYLLRIESSSEKLYASIHPPTQPFERRVACLHMLNDIGFQLGTGVMIGLPGQTVADLADDILFFKSMDVDMIGMGPYLVHNATPMNIYKEDNESQRTEIFNLALRMIGVTRLVLRNVNIAAATALQAIRHDGREIGLSWGANIIMPTVTPQGVRAEYLLYVGKPCLDESADMCKACLSGRITRMGRKVGVNAWGDSKHAAPPNPPKGDFEK